MSNVSDALRNRRSIRKYTRQPVPTEILQEILEAATYAPSAHNAQPWRFIILSETQPKRRLAQAMAQAWLTDLKKDGTPQGDRAALADASVERFTNAPILVVTCLTLKDMQQYPDEERQKSERDLAVQSLSAATQNMLLAAHASGLGACWYCAPVFCKTAVRQALQIPDDVEPQALITIGYAAEKPKPPPRKPLGSIAYADLWGKKL
jgi:coenzyme F420-0:L-glutamate ligase / coenzyme F420-1:gamma-L-glutamate ligase